MNARRCQPALHRILLITTLVFFLSPFSTTASEMSASLTVVTLNARWLFDGLGEEEFSDAPQSPEEAEKHLADVADYLLGVNADFIAIQEIEDASMLHRLNEKLGETYHEVFVQGTDAHTGQDVAALSRLPVLAMGRTDVTQAYPIPESRFRGPRGVEDVAKHLWVTVDAKIDHPITFLVLHLLAYPEDLNRVVRREAQASIIRNLAVQFFGLQHHIVVLGDINDFDAATCDAADNRPRSCVHSLIRDLDPNREGDELVHVADRLDPKDRYTFWYDENWNGLDDGPEEHSMIDHMYVSSTLAASLVDVRIDHAAYEARTVSDHWPLIATFQLP